MEWVPPVIAAIAAFVSVLGAWQSTRATRKRSEGRKALGDAMDAGQRLVTFLRSPEGKALSDDDRWRRVQEWEALGEAAVRKADEAQLPRWNDPVPGSPRTTQVVTARIERLQEIQDRL